MEVFMNFRKGFTLTEVLVVIGIALIVSLLVIQLLYLTFHTTKIGIIKDIQIDEINTIFYKLDYLFNNCENFEITNNVLTFSNIELNEGIPELNYEYEVRIVNDKLIITNITKNEKLFISSEDVAIKNINYIPLNRNQLAIKLIIENKVEKNIVTTPQAKALGLLGVQAAKQPAPGIVAPIPKYLN
jgi:prepilin-type N-terminal cleavage/methylation domain-containing protein